jgi:hypothetical protein
MGDKAKADTSQTSPADCIQPEVLLGYGYALFLSPLTQYSMVMGGASSLEVHICLTPKIVEPVQDALILLG